MNGAARWSRSLVMVGLIAMLIGMLPYPVGWVMGLVGAIRRLREVSGPPAR